MELRFGVITEYDPAAGRVRVAFKDEDDGEGNVFVSPWLPISVRKSLDDKETFPYDVDEHVWCLMDENWEDGVVGGAIYDEDDKPDGAGADMHRIKFKDGSYIQFDRATGDYKIDVKGKATIKSGSDMALDVTGDLIINGGNNHGVIKITELVSRMNILEVKLRALQLLFASWTPVANDGGAALKTLLTSTWNTPLLTQTTQAMLENAKIRH